MTLPVVYIVCKDGAGTVQPIPPEGMVLEDCGGSGATLRTDGTGRAIELPPEMAEFAEKEQRRARRAGLKNVRTTITLRMVG